MAKTRRLTTSISDRFLGSYTDYVNNTQFTNTSTDPDLTEEDVWSMVNNTVDHHEESKTSAKHHNNSCGHHVGGLSLAFEQSSIEPKTASSRVVHQFLTRECSNGSGLIRRGGCFMGTSAPVNVPDWGKIHRVDSVESMMHDDSEMMIPPHEYLARSRNKAASSVFEGVGRTLKGRDLNRVRDAVWSQTGFYG